MQHLIVYFFEEIASDKSFFLVGKSCLLIGLHNFKQNREQLKLCWTCHDAFCRVPIIIGVNKNDGALVWFDRSTLENIFNSGGNKSFSTTAFGTDLGAVTSTERLLTTFYLGRWNPFQNLLPNLWIISDPGRAAWRKTKKQSQTFTPILSLQLLPLR